MDLEFNDYCLEFRKYTYIWISAISATGSSIDIFLVPIWVSIFMVTCSSISSVWYIDTQTTWPLEPIQAFSHFRFGSILFFRIDYVHPCSDFTKSIRSDLIWKCCTNIISCTRIITNPIYHSVESPHFDSLSLYNSTLV